MFTFIELNFHYVIDNHFRVGIKNIPINFDLKNFKINFFSLFVVFSFS
jgi:hypothetical protein